MSSVVRLGDFQHKGTVMLLRELLGRALRGQVAGLAFNVEFRDGTQKTGFTGKYQADHEEALRVANRLSQRTRAQPIEDDYADSGFDDPNGVVRRLRHAAPASRL